MTKGRVAVPDIYQVTITNNSQYDWYVVFTWAPQIPTEDFQQLAWKAPYLQGTSSLKRSNHKHLGNDMQTFSFGLTYQAVLAQQYQGIGGVYDSIIVKDAAMKDNFTINFDSKHNVFTVDNGVVVQGNPTDGISITNNTGLDNFAVGLGINESAAQMVKPRKNQSDMFYVGLNLYCTLVSDRVKLSQVLSHAYFSQAQNIDVNGMTGRQIQVEIKSDDTLVMNGM